MFVTLTRINEKDNAKELVVNTEEVVFITETEPHVFYDKPTKFETRVDEDTGETYDEPVEWETRKQYLVAFKNGKHPQFLDEENYNKLKSVLTK